MKIRYEKCIKCPNACHCCASYHKEGWPRCNECPNNHREFEPASFIMYCPLTGEKLDRPMFDINGYIVERNN